MAEFCGDCIHLDWNNKERYTSIDRYYCDLKGKYVETKDYSCWSYSEDKNRTKGNDNSYTPSGCYITTIICNILAYDDNCELLTILRDFRDNYLKTNHNYIPLLLEYDKIGPLISEEINNKQNKYGFCLRLLQNYLIPCVTLIKRKNYEEAIEIYVNMVNYLKNEFQIPTMTIDSNIEYDIETIGKGRIRQLKTSEI